jgi:MFS transporter, DHA1 family, tetracycline resistance protein
VSRSPALGFILITLIIDILGIGLIVPILPGLIKSFAGDQSQAADAVGNLSSLYALMQFLFAPLLGALSDKVGRRPVLLVSQFGLALDYLLLAYAPSMAWFVVGRVIAGITGANFAAATAYIADVSPPEKRAANFGLVGAAFGIGFIIGPLLGGWLGHYSLRLPFIVSAGLTAANWLYGLFFLPESLKPENRRPLSWAKANPLTALIDLAKRPALFGLALSALFSFVAHTVFPSIWVLYTSYRYGWDFMANGWALAMVGIGAAVVQGGLANKMIQRWGEWRSALWGLIGAAVVYALYGLATEGWMIFAIIALGSIAGIAGPATQGLMSNAVGDDEQGSLQGAITSLESVAGIVGPQLCTKLYAYFVSSSAPLLLPGAPFFAAAVLGLVACWLAYRARRVALANGPKAQTS